MSTVVHTAILMPDQNWNIICTDGMATNVVSHFEEILDFGGNIKFQNCGALNEFKVLNKAMNDMKHRH